MPLADKNPCVSFARRRLSAVIDGLPEAEKLYVTLALYEQREAGSIAATLGLSSEQLNELAERALASVRQAWPVSDSPVRTLQQQAIQELAAAFERTTGLELNAKRQAPTPRANVIPTVPDPELERALPDVRRGSGGELTPPKSGGLPSFHSVRSSCALAVSVFGPWRLRPQTLRLCGLSEFTRLEFEVKFPILEEAHRFKTPPNLDVVAWRPGRIVAVESKFVEQIDPKHTADFDVLYDPAIQAADPRWRAKIEVLQACPDEYRFFNAAQIVKHYLGLKADRTGEIGSRSVTLLYLFWEPRNPDANPFFVQHCAEVADFAEDLGDDQLTFEFLSYPELWSQWADDADTTPRDHTRALESRYLIQLPSG
jgi:hypothetical protein